MNKCHVVIQQSLIMRYQNSWRNCWQPLKWRAWSRPFCRGFIQQCVIMSAVILIFAVENNCGACDIIIIIFILQFSMKYGDWILAICLLCDGNRFFTYLWLVFCVESHKGSCSVTIWHWNERHSVIAVSVLSSTSGLNGTASTEVLSALGIYYIVAYFFMALHFLPN